MNAANVVGRERHFHRFGVAANLFVDPVDHVERSARRSAVAGVTGRDVNGEEVGVQSALLHSRDVRLSSVTSVSRAEVESVVGDRRRDVVVRVYDDGCAVQYYGAFAQL